MSPSDERTWASFTHLAALAGCVGVPFGGVVGPLVVWLLKRNESLYVDEHGKRSLNFQISILIWMLVCVPLVFVIVGIFLLVALAVVNIVCLVVNAIRASRGEEARYPLSLRFVR